MGPTINKETDEDGEGSVSTELDDLVLILFKVIGTFSNGIWAKTLFLWSFVWFGSPASKSSYRKRKNPKTVKKPNCKNTARNSKLTAKNKKVEQNKIRRKNIKRTHVQNTLKISKTSNINSFFESLLLERACVLHQAKQTAFLRLGNHLRSESEAIGCPHSLLFLVSAPEGVVILPCFTIVSEKWSLMKEFRWFVKCHNLLRLPHEMRCLVPWFFMPSCSTFFLTKSQILFLFLTFFVCVV